MIGCVFWLDIGSAVGREHGVTEAQIMDLANYRDSDAFSELQKNVIDYAVALTVTPANATDELVEELRKNLDAVINANTTDASLRKELEGLRDHLELELQRISDAGRRGRHANGCGDGSARRARTAHEASRSFSSPLRSPESRPP